MKQCKDCYYYELCGLRRLCSYYDPISNTNETDDEIVGLFIAKDKKEFIHDWNMYIEQNELD